MNGRVAHSTPFRRRILRGVLVFGCCALSVALSGAVHAPAVRDEAVASNPLQTLAAPLAEEEKVELAAYRPPVERPAGPELLKDIPTPAIVPAPSPIRTPAARRPQRLLMEVTAYCACRKCCGPRAQGLTASGRPVSFNSGRFVAADTKVLKFNTRLLIPGYAGDQPVQVVDRGGAIKGNKLDVFFSSHEEARRWGRQWLSVTVLDN